MAYVKLRPKRGTAAQWTTANTVLAEGEMGIEVPDNGVGSGVSRVKFGDGTTAWNSLPYADATDELLNEITTLQNEMYYKAGDTISNFEWDGGGYLTSSNKTISFTPAFDKMISDDVKSITMTSVTKIEVRHTGGGYLIQGSLPSTSKVTFAKYGRSWRCLITSTTAYSGTNNTPVGVDFRGAIRFS